MKKTFTYTQTIEIDFDGMIDMGAVTDEIINCIYNYVDFDIWDNEIVFNEIMKEAYRYVIQKLTERL